MPPAKRGASRFFKCLIFNQEGSKTDGGGFERLNKLFKGQLNGQLEGILQEIGDRLWLQDVS